MFKILGNYWNEKQLLEEDKETQEKTNCFQR